MKPEIEEKHNKYTVCVRIRPNLQNNSQNVFVASSKNKVKEFKPKSVVTYSFDQVF